MRHTRPVRLSALAASLFMLTAVPAAAVTGPAVSAAETTYAYTAQIIVGDHDRGCSGVLVDEEWLLTAASCFADDPATSLTVPAGKPAKTTTATIGRSDLSSTSGAVREIVELVPRTDRDVVLARLDSPVTGVAPIALATTAPATGEELKLAGYGRSKTEWAPLNLHTGAFSVDSSTATTATVTGKDGVSACMGDTGGPLVRTSGGTAQLAALSSRSYQGGCFGIDAAETRTGGIATRVDDLASWVQYKVNVGRITDFNCDGIRDTAIADPDAAVGGDAGAGLVRIVYGGGKGTAEITQDLDTVPGGSEANDRFGAALATFDHNLDGCTDLVVSAPDEDLGTATDAGLVSILHGAPGGLTTGDAAVALQQGSGTDSLAAMGAESGDRFGYALAAGTTNAGDPYLAVGAPGEDVGDLTDAGVVVYLHGTGTTNIAIDQDKLRRGGTTEAGDQFGAAIAGSPQLLAVGAPGETVGSFASAGGVTVLTHTLDADKLPIAVAGLDQSLDKVAGEAEAGDRFGASVALADSILAVGSPGEALGGAAKAGRVDTFGIVLLPVGGIRAWVTQLSSLYQGATGIEGTAEAGDAFGQTLSAVRTTPGADGTASNTLLAVGVPGEDSTDATDCGTIYVFRLGDGTFTFIGTTRPGKSGIPGTVGASQKVGSAIQATGTDLYIGMPYGPAPYGSVYAVPWANILTGATQTVTTIKPGTGGLPAAGKRFGSAIR
ncbi:S1 family peptidase [Streptomyces sp. YIM S03343]